MSPSEHNTNMTYRQDALIASVWEYDDCSGRSPWTTAMSELWGRSAQSRAVSSVAPTWDPFAALQLLSQSQSSIHILSTAIGR